MSTTVVKTQKALKFPPMFVLI